MQHKHSFQSYFLVILSILSIGLQSCSQKAQLPLSLSSPEARVAISTSEPDASHAAMLVLEAGGNLVDAAVAASFAIAVARPQSTGLGGGGFLIFHNGKTHEDEVWDFREVAPLRATAKMFLNELDEPIPHASETGLKAVAVPGLVAGLYDFHRAHGKLNWKTVLQPAIELAEKGVHVSEHFAYAVKDRSEDLLKDPEATSLFFKADGKPLEKGDLLIQTDLAHTLRGIAESGKQYFYIGDFAQKFGRWMRENGGLISAVDLATYQVRKRAPLVAKWRNYKVVTMPPPSSGGLHLLQMLKIYEDWNQKREPAARLDAKSLIAEVEIMKRVYADRAKWMGDPDFVRVPTRQLLDDSYLEKRAVEVAHSLSAPKPAAEIRPWSEKERQTTHLSFIDKDGNVISTTQTINTFFGSAVVLPETGVVLNNEMDDFSIAPHIANAFGAETSNFNAIAPRKRPLSSMTPTIVLDEKSNAVLALGTHGGTRIITQVYLVLSRFLREGWPIDEALKDCRFHHQWKPDKVMVEEDCPKKKIFSKYYPTEEAKKKFFFGDVNVVGKKANGQLFSAADPHGHGQPEIR